MYPIYRWFYTVMGFSRSQTNGFLIFTPLLVLILFSQPLYLTWRTSPTLGGEEDAKKLDSLVALWPVVPNTQSSKAPALPPSNRIDPNAASRTDLIRIGLPEMLAGRIISYRKKGGRFYSGYDLLKIYGIDSSMLTNIRPRLALPFNTPKREERVFRQEYAAKYDPIRPRLMFDLNVADTAALKRVRGIGEKLALRIVKYRDVLGGFIGPHQLNEIYRLDTAVIRELKKVSFIAPDFTPRRLDVNVEDEMALAAHPYLAPGEAKAIVAYRFQHGKFSSLEDLAQVKALDSLVRKRILPYLEISK